MTANQIILNKQIIDMNWFKKIAVFMLIPAFGEELITRGIIQRYIFPKLPYVGIVVSAWVFENLHYTTRATDTLLYFVSGLVLAIVYHKTARLELTMILHAFTNLVALVLIEIML